ncbi:sin3b-related [Anaeramoeba ignava]|uniref:Sin3b-related n=1 Tax=Anaeramoeba ignava TaxID=1746090 RepID=A0A9Q0LPM6_ANAIG|nr:sin3b-related [Anaeramoeba ignava]
MQEKIIEEEKTNLTKTSGHSYQEISEEFLNEKCSARSFLDENVLNNQFVSFPQGSEENSNKNLESQMDSNLDLDSEVKMEHFEEERYEYDMFLELNFRLLRKVEFLTRNLELIPNSQLLEVQKKLMEDPLFIKAINNIYSENSIQFLNFFKIHPRTVFPILFKRAQNLGIELREKRIEQLRASFLKRKTKEK